MVFDGLLHWRGIPYFTAKERVTISFREDLPQTEMMVISKYIHLIQ
jgi:hypothetical protein